MSEQKLEQLELGLSYEVIEKKIAGRPFMRKDKRFVVSNIVTYKTKLQHIELRDGFNPREIFDGIEELAESLLVDGQREPMELAILKDGRVQLKEGGRRYRAFIWLVDQERITMDYEVLFVPTKSDATEFDILLNSWISNTDHFKKTFDPLAKAETARRFKYDFGKEISDEEVAAIMKVSRQTITNLISISAASDDIKNEIRTGKMNQTQALSFIRQKNKNNKQAESAEINANKNTAAKTPLPFDPNKKELTELKELEEQSGAEEADDLPFVDEEATEAEQEPRISNYNPEQYQEGKPLELAANVVAANGIEKPEKDTGIKYDEGRPEIAQVQNAIKLNDWLSVRVEKLDISAGDKKDLLDRLGWQMNDLLPLRDWAHTNKKQNKRGS